MSIWEMLHPDDVARTRDGFNLTQQGQPAIRFPNRYRRKNGAYRWRMHSDLNYRFLAVNQASAKEFERIFGVRPKGDDIMLDLLQHQPQHQKAVKATWSRALAGEEFTAIDEFRDPTLDRRYYEMKFNSLRDPTGKLVGAFQFVYDVTERLRDQPVTSSGGGKANPTGSKN